MTGEDDEGREGGRIPDGRPKPTPLWALLSRWLLALEAWLRSHGGKRLRSGLRAFWGLIGVAGLVLLFGPVINPPLTFDDITGSASTATDTWIARDFTADYTLTQTEDGRLQAEVVETITAFFPDDVDESGIQRVLPVEYQGHALDPTLLEATIDGQPVDPPSQTTSDRLTYTLDTGQRLSGDHEFTLRYTLQDLAYESTDDASGGDVDLLEWSVFGPSWPQAFSALEVTITMPDGLADRLVRQPRADIAWLLVSGGDWLEPEADSPPGQTTYRFTLDQNIPPNGQAWFDMRFQPGTITMPGPSPVFLVQTFGPLVPLAVLVVTLLFTLAARAVAWSDARGRPWFVAQYDPPQGVSPLVAAQILERPRTRELAGALDEVRRKNRGSRRAALIAAGRAARRTGRVGDRLRARTAYDVSPERRRQISDGFRRIPRGFVRDWFILAPIALTLVQWGIVRQLSHQAKLTIVWWPAAFVLVSTAISLVVLAIALSARPLTRKGALVKQHLRGIGVYAERTRLLERATVTDALLPYALLLEDPREAGRRATELVDRELGDDAPSAREWRTRDFVTWPRILVNALAVLLLGGSIALVSTVPTPYPQTSTFDSYDFDVPGALYTNIDSASVDAVLSRDDGGRARLDVTETFSMSIDDDATRPPQFAQKLPAEMDGQDLGLSVTSIRVDGDDVPFDVTRAGDLAVLATRMPQVLTDTHEVEVVYSLSSPVTAAPGSPMAGTPGATVDRMQWVALLDGWDSWGYQTDGPSPVEVSLTVPDDLSSLAESAGWLREDPDTAESARDWKDSVFPFGTAVAELGPPDYLESPSPSDYGTITEAAEPADGGTRHVLTETNGEYGYPTDTTFSDLGAMLEFPAGTFTGPDAGAVERGQLDRVLPILLVAGLALLAFLIAALAVGHAILRSRETRPGTFRDLVWRLGTASALSAVILFVWASIDMPSDWTEFPPLAISAVVAVVAGVAGIVAVRPEKRADVSSSGSGGMVSSPHSRRRRGRVRSKQDRG